MKKVYETLPLINIFNYDTALYNFREAVSILLEESNLEQIHEKFSFYFLERNKDQSTDFHKKFYNGYSNSLFEKTYHQFIKNFCAETLGAKLINQAKPTFRVHMPKNVGVGEFHKDSDYNHPLEEINFLVPVTDAVHTSTVWIESSPGKEDYKPIDLKYGQVLVFKGGILKHGNKINETNNSRVSFDFRVIPEEQFNPNSFSSINTGMKFDVGGYYARIA